MRATEDRGRCCEQNPITAKSLSTRPMSVPIEIHRTFRNRSRYNCKRTWAICVHAPNGGTKRTELESTQVPIGTESLPLYQVISHQDNLNGLHEIGVAVDMMLPWLSCQPSCSSCLNSSSISSRLRSICMLFLEPPCRTRLRWFNHGI